MKRLLRHLLLPAWSIRRRFPTQSLQAIAQAIAESEKKHRGEIRFALEANLGLRDLWGGKSPQQRAKEVFSKLGVWDTAENNGVLIYLLLADHDVEIVADRGIHERVGTTAWEEICRVMEGEFRQGRFEEAVIAGIKRVGELLAREYPAKAGDRDELSNDAAIL